MIYIISSLIFFQSPGKPSNFFPFKNIFNLMLDKAFNISYLFLQRTQDIVLDGYKAGIEKIKGLKQGGPGEESLRIQFPFRMSRHLGWALLFIHSIFRLNIGTEVESSQSSLWVVLAMIFCLFCSPSKVKSDGFSIRYCMIKK